jgi:hypothetical protein
MLRLSPERTSDNYREGTLWIYHDRPQSDAEKKLPAYYEEWAPLPVA